MATETIHSNKKLLVSIGNFAFAIQRKNILGRRVIPNRPVCSSLIRIQVVGLV
ncbi:hypothetical protein J6590_064327 [Homalodisca vitripennis]|nr:hypothetical protein J6590_064327 [Homalodisca vitripennis]